MARSLPRFCSVPRTILFNGAAVRIHTYEKRRCVLEATSHESYLEIVNDLSTGERNFRFSAVSSYRPDSI